MIEETLDERYIATGVNFPYRYFESAGAVRV
jgi:hypothetical protein